MMHESQKGLCLSVYIITFVLGFPMNFLAFYVFCKKVRQKATPIDILLLNLTISNLLFLIFLPFKMQEANNNMIWNLPYILCPLSGFVFYMTMYNSTFCLMAVSVERYLSVTFPIQHTLKRQRVYAVAACIFFWIFSFVNLSIVIIIPFIGHKDFSHYNNSESICYENFTDAQLNILLPVRLELFVVLFCIPFLISCFCFINFIRILSRLQNINRCRRLRSIGMAVGTLVVFAVCFGPYNISHVVGFITWKSPDWRDKALLCSTLNACLYPFIFYMSSSVLRRTVGSMMKGLQCRFSGCVPSHVFCTSCRSISMTATDKEHNQAEIAVERKQPPAVLTNVILYSEIRK